MTTMEILESLKQLSVPERLVVIETASRLIREEIHPSPTPDLAERSRRMQEAALAVRDSYDSGGVLTEWTSLDGEEILEDYLGK